MTASDARVGGLALRLPRIGDVLRLLDRWTGAALRAPRSGKGTDLLVPAWRRLAAGGIVAVLIVLVSMLWLDAAAIRAMASVPIAVNRAFNEFTDFGRAAWFLVPLGVLYLAVIVAAAAAPGRIAYGVWASIAVRVGFMFVAIGLPGLIGTVVKRLIGRVRPSDFGPYAYHPFSWRSDYASLPSGHTITAFAALVAIGAAMPRLRPLLWTFAVLIALSRVVVSSHFPSDVIAGAAFGAFGAVMVRDWFAARRLGFTIGSDGAVRPLPGPSWRRIRQVAGTAFRT